MRRRSIDWYTLVPVLLMLCIGIIMVLSASSPTTVTGKSKDAFLYFKKQLMWVGLGLVAMFIASNFNYRRLQKFVLPAIVLSFFLLIIVFAYPEKNGAHSWISIGGNQFQPSEFVKLCLILFLARIMSIKKTKMESFQQGLFPALILIGAVCVLILLEPDLGGAMVIAITSFVLLYAGGANWRHLTLLAGTGIGMAVLAIMMAPYRLARITAFLDPFADPRGKGYQIIQSLYAIGSGGLMGAGLGRSMQKFGHIPEQHTDFIFSILSEELGFIGAAFVIVLFIFFASRGFLIAKNIKDPFGSFLACGITTMILVEAVLNIAVVTSSMPVTGITLPFISYGGSSLIFKMAGVGVLLNISRYVEQGDVR